VERVCGEKSAHYRELGEATPVNTPHDTTRLAGVVGVLEAAKADFEGGLLFNLRALIETEVFDDFLDQAEVLLKTGYYIPAASLTGAVLEDTLRKICDAKSIPHPTSTKIDALNVDLARAGVYSKLVQKQITAYADIRNNADHRHFDQFKQADVEAMIKWVRAFASEHLK
jgi:hypothetical protein